MKYCVNCGKEIKEGADICLGCGMLLNKEVELEKKKESSISVKSIVSLILSIIGVMWLALAFLSIEEAKYAYWFDVAEHNAATFIGFYIGYTLLSLVPSIVGFILSILGLKDKSKGIAITGLALSSIVLIGCLIILVNFITTF